MTSLKKNRLGLVLVGILFSFAIAGPAQSSAQNNVQPSLNDASANGTLAVFGDFSKYPPESRPLDTSNWDLLHPWATDTSSLPMVPQQIMRQVDSLRASGLPDEEVLRAVPIPSSLPKYQFEVNKTILAGIQDELRARLIVTPTPRSNLPLRIHVTRAEIIGDSDFGSPHLGAVPFSCEARAPVCTFQWKAPSPQKQYWGALVLEVSVAIDGAADEFVVRQPFYSSPMSAGRFIGSFQEKIENGSLVIAAGVEVQKRMACFVSANLFSADKEAPTHHVERRMIVDPSMKTVEFNFFGKIFRDFGHEGVFRLQDLKAQCENLPYPPEWFLDSVAHQAELQDFQNHPPATKEPSRIYFQYNNYTYTTRKYANNTFADQEWQSPERTRKLDALKKAAAELNNPAMEERKRQLHQQPK